MTLAFILFLVGVVIMAGIYLWSRQRQSLGNIVDMEQVLQEVPPAAGSDAVLVARGHGQLIYANECARNWLGMNGGAPHLERIVRLASPADNLLDLFAEEGQSSFQLGERWVEASSHRIPTGTETRTVVVMRELTSTTTAPDALDLSMAMRLINAIGDKVNAMSGIEETLVTLLNILRQEIPFDAGEICLWDAEDQLLYQRGYVGDMMYLIALEDAGLQYAPGEGISGWVGQHRKPVVVTDRHDPTAVQPKLSVADFQSFVAVPVLLGDEFLGTLEIASKETGAYDRRHLALLQAVGGPCAVSIYNALLYAEQHQRIRDLATLQQTAQVTAHRNDPAPVYASLNQRIAELMGADMAGVFLYDEDREMLVPALPFHGLPDPLVRTIHIPLNIKTLAYQVWDRASYWISNDLSDEPMIDESGLRPVIAVAGIRNTAWLPLEIGSKRIGVLAVSNKRTGDFNESRDLQNLLILAAQVSIVVENLRLFQREQRLDNELAGLQEITHAIGSLTEEGEFYSEITERIARLMGIKACGILLLDESGQHLVAKMPVYGVLDRLLMDYRIPLVTGSVMAQLWEEEDYWISNRVQTDPLVFEAGLDVLAEGIGIEKTLIAPMEVGGRRMGVVQVSDKLTGEDFTDKDARLLQIFAAQTAAILENARLFREARRSADEAQSLRRVAELAGAVLTSKETFAPALAEIGKLMNSDIVFINVLNQQTASLVTFPRYVHGYTLTEPIVLDIYQPGFEHSVSVSREPYIGNDILNDDRVLPGYRTVAQRLDLRKAILVPLVVGDQPLGELGIANRTEGNYDQSDLSVMRVIAAQIAAALDRLLLYEKTGQNLERRSRELDAISNVSNALARTLDLEPVLDVIREEAVLATGADDSTIVMLRTGAYANPAQPEVENRVGGGPDFPPGLSDIELEAINRITESVLITDYEFSTLVPAPTGIRSAIATPILYLDEVVGVLQVFHNDVNVFDDRAAAFLTTLATKASLGYGNYVRYQEQINRSERLRRRVDQLNRIFELGHMFSSIGDEMLILQAIAYSVQQAVGFDTVVMTLVNPMTGELERIAHAGLPLDVFEATRQHTMPVSKLGDLLREEFRISESYFFPVERVQEWYVDGIATLGAAYDGNRSLSLSGRRYWRDGDMLLVVLQGASGDPLGVISLDRPHDNMRPGQGEIEVLEIFAHQATTALENLRLLKSSEQGAEREARLSEIAEATASTFDINEIVRVAADGAYALGGCHALTIALQQPDGDAYDLYRAVSDGTKTTIETEQVADLAGTVLGRAIQYDSEYAYTADAAEWQQYADLRDAQAHGTQSAFVMPLATGAQYLGAMSFSNQRPGVYERLEASAALRRIGQIVISAVQNARLFHQAVNLQVLNESVLESIQQGIIVLDSGAGIISLNGFMRDRYHWDEGAIGQNLFDYEPELERVLRELIDHTLAEGEKQELINQDTTRTDGSIVMQNFYAYPLRYGDTVRGAVVLIEDVSDRARLEQTMEQRAHQLAALTEVSTRITSTLERDEVIALTVEEMGWLVAYDNMTLWQRVGNEMQLEGKGGLDGKEAFEPFSIKLSEHPQMQQIFDTQHAVILNRGDEFTVRLPGEEDAQSWLGVPLISHGRVIGAIVLSDDEPEAYASSSDQNVAQAFASQVAIALSNADLFEQTFDRTNELSTLLEAAQTITVTQDLDAVFKTVIEMMFTTLDVDDCTIMTWYEVDDELEVQAAVSSIDGGEHVLSKGTRLDLSRYPGRQHALRQREVVVVTVDDEMTPYPEEIEALVSSDAAASMIVPLVVRDQAIGLLQLGQRKEHIVTQQKVRMARALGAQVAIAIQNAQLTAEMSTQYSELMIINELSRTISGTLELDQMLQVVGQQVPQVTGAGEMYIALYDDATQMISFPLAMRGSEAFEMADRPLNTDEVSFVIKNRRPLTLGSDYFMPDDLRRSLGITNGEGDVKSYLGQPIFAGNKVAGVLALRDRERTRAFNVNDSRILEIVGSQLGAAIQNALLFNQISNFAADLEREVADRTIELEQERDRIEMLYQITSELATTLDMDMLLTRALGMVAKAVDAQDGAIMLIDPITDQLYSRSVLNKDALLLDDSRERAYHPAENLAQWLVEQDEQSIVVNDLHTFAHWDTSLEGADVWHSALAVLLEADNDLHGVMVLLSDVPDAFGESQSRLVVAAANQVAAAIDKADLYQLIRDQAERLRNLLRAEQEEAEKSSSILEGIADGVILADAKGTIIRFNAAAERIIGVPRDQAIGQPIARVTGLYSGNAASWSAAMEAYQNEGADMTEFIDERLPINDKIVSVHLSPVYNNETFLGTVSVFRDITRDVEVDRIKSEFISSVSHEFRTPLTPIKGYVDLLLMGAAGALAEPQSRIVTTIKENVERLTLLVEDVLNISQIDSGRERLKVEEVDLNQILEDVLANLIRRHGQKGITVTFDEMPGLPRIQADADKLNRVFTNIVDNAYKYTVRGGNIDITIRKETARKHVQISVQDTGVGIPEAFHDKVWRRFERHDDTALTLDVAGTGLGMPIAKELVEMHGGDIWFESAEGEGTTFYISLPITQPEYRTASLAELTATHTTKAVTTTNGGSE